MILWRYGAWTDSNNDFLIAFNCKTLNLAAKEADFFLNSWYHLPKHTVKQFKKALLLDIGPANFNYGSRSDILIFRFIKLPKIGKISSIY